LERVLGESPDYTFFVSLVVGVGLICEPIITKGWIFVQKVCSFDIVSSTAATNNYMFPLINSIFLGVSFFVKADSSLNYVRHHLIILIISRLIFANLMIGEYPLAFS
jgi:hypothetical protein